MGIWIRVKFYLLKTCIAEVTNTPWGERMRINFFPRGARVPKCSHASPFLDMQG
ncbi:predicted protein [Micromonas commoda]|uniref:Uncharacterized protein n=1 Tax=Micromonas commoda (strain RCC299 / NOUM17 / CCMP2709) TaxID=296587 RepID=C1FDN4_MICCC|nr:predicted protein [Micromonas commoda]ACO68423.1 predicted protein [Micromonas commoda]|eukprot:XP_002507165.1 predicted protein [Micromonas commoda]